jgi:UDP-N-acetylmuramoyl-tripeptide--D-alanyl-D-alanine ligase
MNLWAYPYFFYYLAIFFFWMVAAHRQILFWLCLWQLKEYHWGRFLAHFETQKGKRLFFNPLFLAKIAALIFGAAYYFLAQKIGLFVLLAAGLFFLQGLRGFWGILRRNLIHPELTQKSVFLIAATHLAVFGLGLLVFFLFLGEMSLLDLAYAAFCLLAIDILIPLIISLVVLGLQPLTIWKKNKIINRARAIIAGRADLTVIGIAGSYGKSGVKELLAHILSQKYKVLKTQANQNTEMGVSQTVINDLKPEHQIFVCEIGAVHKGKICQTAEIIKPKIGILTGINQQHLGVFGGQKNIIDAKFELLEALPAGGAAILNFASLLVRENFDAKKDKINAQKIIFAGKDIFASDIESTIDDLSFILNYQDQKIKIDTNARGAWMAETIILSIAGAAAAGVELAAVAAIVNQTDFTPFNLELKRVGPFLAKKGPTLFEEINIINSTYSANPDGVMAHLDYLKHWPGGVNSDTPSKARGKKAVMMPCLIELGNESKKIHFEIGKKIGEVCDLAIITAKERFGDIKKGALAAGMNPENIVFCDNPRKIARLLSGRLSSGDVLFLEGRLPQNLIQMIQGLK